MHPFKLNTVPGNEDDSEPPSKRPRQLKLFGSTKNELTETEIKE